VGVNCAEEVIAPGLDETVEDEDVVESVFSEDTGGCTRLLLSGV